MNELINFYLWSLVFLNGYVVYRMFNDLASMQ
jgi:hypothetical protein